MDESIESLITEAAQEGNINTLYALIRLDPFLLERIDQVPFVHTPLHTAAAAGHLQFAMEMMNLKPSFARKLNQDGFSAMHLALQNGHAEIACRLIEIDRDLIRVKGREGITPLHYVTEKGDLNLLAEFLSTCEESIKDLTIRRETALHIAVKNNMFEALEVLVGWLRRTVYKDAWSWEEKLLNWKDDEGNTVLHIATSRNQPQVVRLLLSRPVNTNAKNLEGLTAMDILESQKQFDNKKVRDLLYPYGALRGSLLPSVTARADRLRSKMSRREALHVANTRARMHLSGDVGNLLVVVAVLIVTATYQAGLTPPGGVWQDDKLPPNATIGAWQLKDDMPPPITYPRGLIPPTTYLRHEGNDESVLRPHIAGISVMLKHDWTTFMTSNTIAFVISILTLYSLFPLVPHGQILLMSLSLLLFCYFISLWVTMPIEVALTSLPHFPLLFVGDIARV